MAEWTVKAVDGVEVKSKEEKEKEILKDSDAPIQEGDEIKVKLDEPTKKEGDAGTQEETKEETENGEQLDESTGQSEEAKPEGQEEEPQQAEEVLELIQDETEDLRDIPTDSGAEGVESSTESASTPPQQEEVPQAEPQIELPEGIEKLLSFMDETGGTLEDYVQLNKDISALNDVDVIKEYYRQTKPGYDDSDISFLMDKKFLYNEDSDDPTDVREKQLAFKDELFKARKHLETSKEKYYADLVSRKQNDIPPEYQEAASFYNEYKQSQESNTKLTQEFMNRTDKVFNDNFKGFDFKVGDNKYRYKVNDKKQVREYQSDLNNLISEFVGKDGSIEDAQGYHKAIFAAKNADKIAQHFYEQGRADAIKQGAATAKNIDMKPRADASSVVTKSGMTVKVLSGDSKDKFKLNLKNY